ncbi:MAG: hypothetical protein M0Z43_13510 [Acidithiobacillus sp.]|nr:hypothetical protein [Acidithiobacillus sp.]
MTRYHTRTGIVPDYARWVADADALIARREAAEWREFWRLFFD